MKLSRLMVTHGLDKKEDSNHLTSTGRGTGLVAKYFEIELVDKFLTSDRAQGS